MVKSNNDLEQKHDDPGQRGKVSSNNDGADPGKGNAMPDIPDRIDPTDDPKRSDESKISKKDDPSDREPRREERPVPDDGGLSEDDPDGETRA